VIEYQHRSTLSIMTDLNKDYERKIDLDHIASSKMTLLQQLRPNGNSKLRVEQDLKCPQYRKYKHEYAQIVTYNIGEETRKCGVQFFGTKL
jgi:hypothetical protein